MQHAPEKHLDKLAHGVAEVPVPLAPTAVVREGAHLRVRAKDVSVMMAATPPPLSPGLQLPNGGAGTMAARAGARPPRPRRTWLRPSQSHASAMSLVSLSTGSEEMSSMRGGSPSGVPVGTLRAVGGVGAGGRAVSTACRDFKAAAGGRSNRAPQRCVRLHPQTVARHQPPACSPHPSTHPAPSVMKPASQTTAPLALGAA